MLNWIKGLGFLDVMRFFLLFLLLFAAFKLPGSPYELCGSGYCDRTGKPADKSLYETYEVWKWLFWGDALIVLILSVIQGISEALDEYLR